MRSPLTPAPSSRVKSSGARSRLVESLGSNPSMALNTSAASSAERVRIPAWSRLDAKAIMPQREARP